MKVGDRVLFYHSVTGKEVVGIAEVERAAYPDPSATEGDWSCVDLRPVSPLRNPVPLETIKATDSLQEIGLLRQSRLSVMPLTAAEFRTILRLGSSG
jgi:predicted RNA-binding protein with PUA-like domain